MGPFSSRRKGVGGLGGAQKTRHGFYILFGLGEQEGT